MIKNSKYTWDLDDLLNQQSYQDLENQYLAGLKKMVGLYEQNIFTSIKKFRQFHEVSQANNLLANRLYNYIENNRNCDLANNYFSGLEQSLNHKTSSFFIALANFENDVIKNKKQVLKYLQAPDLKELTYKFHQIFVSESHCLSPEIEKYESHFDPLVNAYEDIFTTIIDQELKVQPAIDSKQKIHVIHNSEDVYKYLKHDDRQLRKSVWINWYSAINHFRETFAKLLYFFYLNENIRAKVRQHKDYVAAIAFDDEVDLDLIQHIYKSVKSYASLVEDYRQIHHKILKVKYQLKKLEVWDLNLSVGSNKEKFTIEEAQTLAKNALAVLDADYVDQMQKAFDNNWIDWLPRKNKLTGAYCIGATKGLNKIYVLLNFKAKLDDVNTLVHELGHAIHAVESNKFQNTYAESAIFYAEIASITNEILLALHLLQKYQNQPQKKLLIYDELIHNFLSTTSFSIADSLFEWEVNEIIQKGEPFNAEIAVQLRHKINVQYTKVNPKEKDFQITKPLYKKSLVNVLTIPHFYMGNFYVYKYAIGQVCAVLIAHKIFAQSKDALKQYYAFLRSGSSLSPLETIKILGIDLTQKQPWEEAQQVVKQWLKEYANLAAKINKIKVKLSN